MMSIFRRHGRAASYLMITDWIIIVGAFGLALRIRRYQPDMDIINLANRQVVPEVVVAAAYALLLLGCFSALHLYKRRLWLSRPLHLYAIVKGVALQILGYLLLKAITKIPYFVPSRLALLWWAAFTLSALVAHRLIFLPLLLRVASQAGLRRRVALIGDSDLAHDFMHRWRDDNAYSTLLPIGLITDKTCPLINDDLPRLGKLSDLPDLVEPYGLEGSIITNPNLSHAELMKLIEQCIALFGWVDVHSDKTAIFHQPTHADYYFDAPFIRLSTIPRNPLYHAYKRLLDIIAAALGAALLLPVWLPVALLIKLTSPGPIFYTRPRLGQYGRPFEFYKFRSMRVGADQDPLRNADIIKHIKDPSAVSAKTINPAMVTPTGRFIRKWAIDELPQLWNVIRGDMSLVGPRPLPQNEFDAQDEWQKKRFEIKPGCTGLWKIMTAREGGITFANTALYDLYYARNMNPLLDLHIILQTVWVILRGKADG